MVGWLSSPSTTTYMLAVEGNNYQWVRGNQETRNVEGGCSIDHEIHHSADDKRNKAHLKIKQEGHLADGKGYAPHWS